VSAGLVDTSVIIDWHEPAVVDAVPEELAVSTITLAELATGPLLARDPAERARRQVRLQLAESTFDPLDFDRAASRSYGRVVSALNASGRSHRGRIADLFIAATAHARALPLYTRNARDFGGLEQLIDVVEI
jgi:predicted nucleic acid-binding protein